MFCFTGLRVVQNSCAFHVTQTAESVGEKIAAAAAAAAAHDFNTVFNFSIES